MKRRGFLRMLGAAAAAPLLPAIPSAATAAAGYNRYQYGLAVFHARTRAHVSARGLAYCLKVTPAQAQAMIAEMSAKGMVTPVTGSGGSVRAVSNILKPDMWGLDKSMRQARSRARRSNRMDRTEAVRPTDWIDYLRDLCRAEGMTLQPRVAMVTV